jgi:hypothetical protein
MGIILKVAEVAELEIVRGLFSKKLLRFTFKFGFVA